MGVRRCVLSKSLIVEQQVDGTDIVRLVHINHAEVTRSRALADIVAIRCSANRWWDKCTVVDGSLSSLELKIRSAWTQLETDGKTNLHEDIAIAVSELSEDRTIEAIHTLSSARTGES